MRDLELLPFRFLIDRVPLEARRHFGRLFLPIAAPLVIVGLVYGVVQSRLMADLAGQADPAATGWGCGVAFLAIVVGFLVNGLALSALMVASMDAVRGRPVDLRRAWTFPLRPPVLATLVVVAGANVLSVLALVLPALYVLPLLAYVLPAMVAEDRRGFDAVRRSIELVHFNPTGRWTDSVWLQTLVLLVIGIVIQSALTFTVQLPFLVLQQVMFFRDAAAGELGDPAAMAAAGPLWLLLVTQVMNGLANAASWFYWTFGISLLFREVVKRKEAEDLREEIDALTGAVPTTGSGP